MSRACSSTSDVPARSAPTRPSASRRRRVRGRDRPEAPGRRRRRAPRRPGRDRRRRRCCRERAIRLGAPCCPTYARADVTFVDGEGAWLVADDGRATSTSPPASPSSGSGTATRRRSPPRRRSSSGSGTCRTCTGPSRWPRLASGCPSGSAARRRSSATRAPRRSRRRSSTRARRPGKPGVVALEGSFHGRTIGALAATGQPAKRAAVRAAARRESASPAPNDVASLEAAAAGDTAADPARAGAGRGRRAPARARVPRRRGARARARALLCFDEVQTGVGRTGTFFACEQLGVRPDLVTLAKGLANGLPIGALLVADDAAPLSSPGDHASTFGGNPVACAAACAVVDAIDDDCSRTCASGRAARAGLAALPGLRGARRRPAARRRARPAGRRSRACLDAGLVVLTAGAHVSASRRRSS